MQSMKATDQKPGWQKKKGFWHMVDGRWLTEKKKKEKNVNLADSGSAQNAIGIKFLLKPANLCKSSRTLRHVYAHSGTKWNCLGPCLSKLCCCCCCLGYCWCCCARMLLMEFGWAGSLDWCASLDCLKHDIYCNCLSPKKEGVSLLAVLSPPLWHVAGGDVAVVI